MEIAPVEITIEATVDEALRTVSGRMSRSGGGALTDPLAALPLPQTDLVHARTFPGRTSRGEVTFSENADGTITFTADLPRRFGAIGATRHGLFANGGWYPQLEGLPITQWDVQVTLPPNTGGALGDQLGTEVLRWSGLGDRVPLAVVRRPVFTALDDDPSDVTLLTRGRARATLVKELGAGLARVPEALTGAVVEAPLRRRLTYAGPGLAYVSDRAFRLSIGLPFAHRRSVIRGVATALAPLPDPFDRAIAGAALGRVADRRLTGEGANKLLGTFAWIPTVNVVLASEQIPFYSEVLDLKWPGDPVHDDLAEVYAPSAPGEAVLAQVDNFFGGQGTRFGLAVAAGVPAPDALEQLGIPRNFLDPWRVAFPPQDYRLDVVDGQVWVERNAPPEAPAEVIDLVVDGQNIPLTLAPGEKRRVITSPPHSVALDPGQHTYQTSRHRDTWPARYDPTVSFFVDTLNVSEGLVFASGTVTLRRQYDTRNLWVGSIWNSAADLFSARFGWLRKEGRLLNGWTRAHRIRADVGFSVFNPKFADTAGNPVAVDAVLSWTHDTRVSSNFPLRGHKLTLATGAGGIPGTPLTWTNAAAQAIFITSPHPRWAIASRTTVGAAASPLDHRLLLLGGTGAMRAIPALPACQGDNTEGCFPVASSRFVTALETRWAPLRDLDVPLLFGWLSEIQLDAGAEGLFAFVNAGPSAAVSATVGATTIVDIVGAKPAEAGVTLGWPVWWYQLPLERSAAPTLYLRFTQSF